VLLWHDGGYIPSSAIITTIIITAIMIITIIIIKTKRKVFSNDPANDPANDYQSNSS
jgi:hypothetical protein